MRHFTLLGLLLAGSSLLPAGVLYDSGGPNGVNGFNISTAVESESFTLTNPATLRGLIFLGSSTINNVPSLFSGTIGFRILSDNSGSPGTSLAVGADSGVVLVDNLTTNSGTEEFQFRVNLPDIVLGPGVYWLTLHEGAMGTAFDGTSIFWDTTGSTTSAPLQKSSDLTGNAGYTENLDGGGPVRTAFQLLDTPAVSAVPEPATSGALLTGVSALLVLRRKRG